MSGRFLIAGTGSGSGKTSITCGLLAAFRKQGLRVSACKCGPDYIDPMFHREVLGVPSRNLDLFLCGEAAVRNLLARSCAEADLTVIEGVMGFYDGLAWTEEASASHLANCTETSVLLVADCRGKALTLAAEVGGIAAFRPNRIGGVLFNRCSARSYPMLKKRVEEETGLPVLGYLPHMEAAVLQSRHLGLVTAVEVEDLQQKFAAVAAQMEETVDLDEILLLAAAPPLPPPHLPARAGKSVRIGVARDKAFCFAYGDNYALLEELGAELVFFSPLADRCLPKDIHGLLLPGGYPELYARELSGNRPLLAQIRASVERGLPTLAECGGYMLLCRSLQTVEGRVYPMAGAIDTDVAMSGRLSRFGYITLTAREDTLLCQKGETIRAHEFHYSESGDPGSAFAAEKPSGAAWHCVHGSETLHAGYPHIHFRGNEQAAERFVKRCAYNKGERP